MQEIKTGQPDAPEEHPAEKKDTPETPDVPRGASHESLWGAVLFACMILFVIASIGGVGWVAYSKWKGERAAESRPSIAALSERTDAEAKDAAAPESSQAQASGQSDGSAAPADTEIAAAAKKLEVSVLNGGSTKGSAGVLADFLKQEGYSKTGTGNTLKDYAGVSIYYAAALEKEAEAIKESVMKKYPQAKILPADTANKETTVSQVTIILGK